MKTSSARSPLERLEPGRAPSRPRGLQAREPSRFVSKSVRFISALFTLALVGMVVASGIGFAIYHQYEKPGPLTETKTIVIPKGEGRIAIAERLERAGIISNRWTFIGGHLLQSFLSDNSSTDLKAGEYELAAGASMRDVLDIVSDGRSILYKVTIPEGLTSLQIVERLRANSQLSGEIDVIPEEGTLMPDTYLVSKGTRRQEILERMQRAMSDTIAELWEKRQPDLPLRTPQEAVTLASIVEKETGHPEERDRVAAVFYNRLRKGMRLESDPTIVYGLVGGEGSLGRPITKDDIASQTPYNTYRINGLPPGPIANPGGASLQATVNPAKTNEIFFVADGTGGHTFTENYKDHKAAVRKWRDFEKERRASGDTGGQVSVVPGSDEEPPSETETATSPQSPLIMNAGPNPKVIQAPPSENSARVTDIPLPVRKPAIN